MKELLTSKSKITNPAEAQKHVPSFNREFKELEDFIGNMMMINLYKKIAKAMCVFVTVFTLLLSFIFVTPALSAQIDVKKAVKLAKKKYPGKVLKSKKLVAGGGLKYKIKIVQKNGKVLSLVVDGNTGKVRKQ